MKKNIKLIVSLFIIFTFVSPMLATEDNSGKIGMILYELHKPRIAKGGIVFDIVPESPAWNAGIRLADRIIKVDNMDVTNMPVNDITKLISGKVGSSVNLTLITKNGIQEFNIKRVMMDASQIMPYPHWYQICNNAKTEGEICYIHPGQYQKKASDNFKIMGPYSVNHYGVPLAYQRYQFEENLRLCQNSNDKAMCYLELKRMEENRLLAQQSLQLQRAQLINQTLNGLNNDLNMQMMNQNLNNINGNLNNIKNNVQMMRY